MESCGYEGLEGATDYDYSKGKIYININPTAFKDPRYLALTVGHELVHARDIANGNHLEWLMQFGPDESPWSPMWVIMETHAWAMDIKNREQSTDKHAAWTWGSKYAG